MNEPLVKKNPLVGVGVVIIKDRKVLLGKRKGAHGLGDWSFPGGHLEFKESVEECAKRELEEETGLKALSVKLGPWTEDVMETDKHYVTLFVFVGRFTGELKLLEPHKCERWEWFGWNELPSPLFLPVKSLIEKLGLENLQNRSEEALLSSLFDFEITDGH